MKRCVLSVYNHTLHIIQVKEDECYMTATNFNGVYIVGKRKPDAEKKQEKCKLSIADAIKNVARYQKK